MNPAEILKDAYQCAKKGNQADLVEKLMDARQAMLDLVEEKANIEIELNSAREKIAGLEKQLALVATIKFEHDAYWCERLDGTLEGPYSTRCWDKEKKLVRFKFSYRKKRSGNLVFAHEGEACEIPLAFLQERRVFSDSSLKGFLLGGGE
jgi:hypothetical protein